MAQYRKQIKSFVEGYQKIWFYSGFFIDTIRRPFVFLNETLLILTFLAVRGISPEAKEVVGFYLLAIITSVIGGRILVWLGFMRVSTRLGNIQNPELMEIYKEIKAT